MNSVLQTRTMANLYVAQGHPGRAIAILRRLLAMAPNDPELLALLASAKSAPTSQDLPPEEGEDHAPPLHLPSLAGMPKPAPAPTPDARPATTAGRPVPQTPAPRPSLQARVLDSAAAFVVERAGRLLERVLTRRRR
jgi:hypothetical protein